MGGTKYAQSSATQTLPSYLQGAYENVIGRANSAASTPYTPYSGGFTPDQQTAFRNIASMWGSSNPAFNNASTALSTSMIPTYGTVGSYMSPYISNVADAMKANIQETNAQQEQALNGNAIAKGAFGGNRVGVAQGELARQQGLASNQSLSDLYNTGYGTALGAAQADKQAALNAASGYTGLGSTQTQTGLMQAGAQLGAGTQQQQFNYQQYLNALAFPYQQTSWLGSIAGGLAPSAGGTTTRETPQGNIWSQLLGAGLGVASLFKKDGGRVHAADGGVMGTPYANDNSMWPSFMHGAGGSPYGANDNGEFQSYVPKVAVRSGRGGFPTIEGDPLSSMLEQSTGGLGVPSYYRGGEVHAPVMRKGYAGGGMTDQDVQDMYAGILKPGGGLVGDAALPQAIARRPQDPAIDTTAPINGDNLGLGMGNTSAPDSMAYTASPDEQGVNVNAPMSAVTPQGAAFPSYSSGAPFATGDQFTTTPTSGYSQNIGDVLNSLRAGKGLNLSPDVRQALMAAGFGMMASKSPFALQGIGEGGLEGIQAWNARQQLERENAAQRAANAMTGSQIANQAATTAQTQVNTGLLANKMQPSGAGLLRYKLLPNGETQAYRIPMGNIPVEGSSASANPTSFTGAQPVPGNVLPNPQDGVHIPIIDTADMPDQMMNPDAYPGLLESGKKLTEPATEASTAAHTLDTSLGQMVDLAKDIPNSGPLVQGAGFESRLALVKGANTVLSAAGLPTWNPDQLATAEDFNKLARQLNFAVAGQATSDPGLGVVLQAAAASPSGENSKQGALRVISNLMAVNQRSEDRAKFLNQWSSTYNGVLQTKNGTADDYFNKLYTPQTYINMGKAINKALLSQPVAKSEFDLLPSELKTRYAPRKGP